MIKLKDARLLDGLPGVLSDTLEAKALSYAIDKVLKAEIWPRIERLKIYSGIDTASDDILDALAAELAVPSYSQSYNIDVKRELVKGAISYWQTAGSAQTVEDICRTIFGDAEVLEWFNFGGDPGTYKVLTSNPGVTGSDVKKFEAVAESVKRLSQKLISVTVALQATGDITFAGVFRSGTVEILREESSR